MSRGDYVLGSVELLVMIAALGFAAWRIRAMLVPGWSRSPARLVEAILALSLFTVIAQLVGLVGLLDEIPLLLGALVAAAATEGVFTRRASSVSPSTATCDSAIGPVVAGVVVGGLILARWLIPVQGFLDFGMWPFDNIAYHMPIAAGFAQSGPTSVFRLTGPLNADGCPAGGTSHQGLPPLLQHHGPA